MHLGQDHKFSFQQVNLIKNGSKTNKKIKIFKLEVITKNLRNLLLRKLEKTILALLDLIIEI